MSDQYLYAETTSLESLDLAISSAQENLHAQVLNLLTEKAHSAAKAEALWQSLKPSCQALTYQHLASHRAFVYLSRQNVMNANEVQATPASQPELVTVAQPEPVAQPATSAQPIQTPTPVSKPEPQPEPPLLNLDDFDIPDEELEKPLQQDVNAILGLGTYESVMLYLDAMQDDGRLVYGRIATLTSPETAYLIIVKDGKLITVLGQGKGERMNLKTHTMEPVQKYRGYAIIWMKTFK